MSIISTVMSAVTPSVGTDPDAIQLLKADHEEVDGLLKDYERLADDEGSKAEERRELSRQICEALVIHATIEEEIFYPAAKRAGVDPKLLNEAEVEHGSVKDFVAQIGLMNADDTLYDAKVQVLGEYVRHHVKEEENELFTACRGTEMDMQALGKKLQARKASFGKA